MFGGSKESEAMGGCIRKVRIIDGLATSAGIKSQYEEYRAANPIFKSAATKIQSMIRRCKYKMRHILGKVKSESRHSGDNIQLTIKHMGGRLKTVDIDRCATVLS